jgi:hypothetical protein
MLIWYAPRRAELLFGLALASDPQRRPIPQHAAAGQVTGDCETLIGSSVGIPSLRHVRFRKAPRARVAETSGSCETIQTVRSIELSGIVSFKPMRRRSFTISSN